MGFPGCSDGGAEGDSPLAPAWHRRRAAGFLPGAGVVDVVVLEVRQEACRALVLANALELAPGGLGRRDARATALAGVEIPHQLVDVEVLCGFLEFVRLFVLEFFFRLLAH